MSKFSVARHADFRAALWNLKRRLEKPACLSKRLESLSLPVACAAAYDVLPLREASRTKIMSFERATENHPSGIWKWSLRPGFFIALAIGWELLADSVDSLLMPAFTETLAALARLLMTSQLWEALWVSNQAMALGFALAVITGIPLGFLMGRWRAAEKLIGGWSFSGAVILTSGNPFTPLISFNNSRRGVAGATATVVDRPNLKPGSMVRPERLRASASGVLRQSRQEHSDRTGVCERRFFRDERHKHQEHIGNLSHSVQG